MSQAQISSQWTSPTQHRPLAAPIARPPLTPDSLFPPQHEQEVALELKPRPPHLMDLTSTIDLSTLASAPPHQHAHSAPFESALSRWQMQARALGFDVDLDLVGNSTRQKTSPASSCSLSSRSSSGSLRSSGSTGLSSTEEAAAAGTAMQTEEAAAFFGTRSRVVRLHNLPANAEGVLSVVFQGRGAMLWKHSGWAGSVFAVFRTHDEACAALGLSGPTLSVAPATHDHLVPHTALQPYMMSETYTLSSNPPNPKTSFRLGDWICPQPNCAAHNFGRNVACIGCGCPRSGDGSLHPHALHQMAAAQGVVPAPAPAPAARSAPSPRFSATLPSSTTYYSSGPMPVQHLSLPSPTPSAYSPVSPTGASAHLPPSTPSSASGAFPIHASKAPSHTHPLLTPSGRAFAVGGKVQNVSSDPLNPCVMYWPDNEPFPEQGQIRPSGVVGVAPPILNTGNRGPISHQPGDWICQKCNYLNWRRRKVCQTCLPYAEGNGDSISAAVQAERIALLTSVLSQGQPGLGLGVPTINANAHATQQHQNQRGHPLPPRSHSLTPPHVGAHAHAHPSANVQQQSARGLQPNTGRTVHRSQSHFALGQSYALGGAQTQQQQAFYPASPSLSPTASPIYQTSGHAHAHGHGFGGLGQGGGGLSPGARISPSFAHAQSQPQVRLSPSLSQLSVHGHGQHQQLYATGLSPTLGVDFNASLNARRASFTAPDTGSGRMPPIYTPAPAPLLPSFLQEMVRSPPPLSPHGAPSMTTTASPTTTTSPAAMPTAPAPADLPDFSSSASSEEDGSGGDGDGSGSEGFDELVSPVSAAYAYAPGIQVHAPSVGGYAAEQGFGFGVPFGRAAGAGAAGQPFALGVKQNEERGYARAHAALDLGRLRARARGASGSSDDDSSAGGEAWMRDSLLGPGVSPVSPSSIWRLDGEESRGLGAGAPVGAAGAFGAVGSGRKTRC